MFKGIWYTVSIILLPFLVRAQTVVEPEWLTINDGLSQGYVSCILQDREGFLWMGTKNGLNRYDGEHFEVFTHDPSNPYSILADHINSLYEYGDFLLVATDGGGLNLFHKKTKRFYRIPLNDSAIETNVVLYVYNLIQDSLGQFWFIGQLPGRLYKLHFPADFQRQDLPLEERVQAIEVRSHPDLGTIHNNIIIDHGDGILVVKSGMEKIYQVDIRTGEAKLFEHQIAHEHQYFIKSFVKTKNRVLMKVDFNNENEAAGYLNSLYILEKEGWRLINKNFYIDNFSYLEKKQQDWIIINADGKFLFFEETRFDKSSIELSTASFTIPNYNVSNHCMVNDRSDITWIGTSGYGVMKLSPRLLKIKTYFKGKSIYTSPLATSGGEVFFYNQTTSEYLYNPGDLPRLAKLYHEPKNIFRILEDRDANFWASEFYNGHYYLCKVGSAGTLERRWQIAPTGTSGPILNYEPENNTILIASITTGAFNIYNIDQDLMQTFDFQDFIGSGFLLYAITKTKNDHYWIGSSQGLIHAIPGEEGFTFELLEKKEGDLTGLLNNQVSSLLRSPEDGNILWIGTKGGGLHRLDTRDMTFTHVNSKNGLPNDVIYGILNDDHGHLWMSSNKGIIRYHTKTGQIRNFTKADGLQSDEFNTYAYYKSKDGTMLFGGINGLNIFHPNDLQDNPVTPEVWITGLEVNNNKITVGDSTTILDQAIEYTRDLSLPFEQNSISLKFAALEYSAPSKNRFRFYLEGAEEEWAHESTENIANYLNLSPGEYTFKIKGANGDGIWSEQIRSLKISILPPWYRSTLAYFIYALLIGLLIWWYLRLMKNRLRLKHEIELEHKESERLKELDLVKSRFFTNISHEFRTPLTIISGMMDKIEEHPEKWTEKGRKMVRRNSNNLLNLVNQILDLRKLESGKLELNLIQSDLIIYLKYIVESFQSYAEGKDIQLHFQTERSEVIMDFDPEKILRIVSNLLSNAIKFTPEGGDVFINTSIEKVETENIQGSIFNIQIRDTGIGIPPDKIAHIFDRFYQVDDSSTRRGEGSGIGLALTYELVKLMNGDIEVSSRPGKGTLFTLKIPIQTQAPLALAKDDLFDQKEISQTLATINFEELETTTILHYDPSLPSLLIVEDNPDVRQYLIACLEDQFQLYIAKDGEEGIDKAIEHIPDIIISDVMMPRKDGFELCQKLKTDERTSHIPIVLLTAKADQDSRISGLERGADDYLTKPFNKKELFVRLKNLLKIRQKLQERYSSLEALSPTQEIALQQEDEFITKVRTVIEENLDDETFGIAELCKAVAMSRTQLHRKIKALTNRSTSLYVRSVRLQKAKYLLKNSDLNIAQVAYEVGFSNPNYFSRIFSEEFGIPPTYFRK